MKIISLAALLLLLAIEAACSPAPPQPMMLATTSTIPPSLPATYTPTVLATMVAGCERQTGMIEQACTSPSTGLRYWLSLPKPAAIPREEKPPLLIYLHGFNHSGNQLILVADGGIPARIENGLELPMIVISPQCPFNDNWQSSSMVERLSKLIKEAVDRYDADEERVLLTGFSMGGDGVWALGIAHPEQFAALVPVASWYEKIDQICALKDVPVWDFQSERDEIVASRFARQMTAALQQCGGTARLTLFDTLSHEESSTEAYRTEELYRWLDGQREK